MDSSQTERALTLARTEIPIALTPAFSENPLKQSQ
jgi:hypothetical protein